MKGLLLHEEILLKELLALAGSVSEDYRRLTVGSLISILRRRLGMTQSQLAKRAGKPQSTIARIEKGEGKSRLDLLGQLFAALNCDLAVLPIPKEDPGEFMRGEAERLARKRVGEIAATRAMEAQELTPEAKQALLERETRELLAKGGIWDES